MHERLAVLAARQHARKIHAETVDVHLAYPDTRGTLAETRHDRVIAVDRVADPREIEILASILGIQVIEEFVHEPLEADRGAARAGFGRMVQNGVEDDRDTRLVQRLHHVAKLGARIALRGKFGMQREEAVRAIAPIIREAKVFTRGRQILTVERHHGQELHRGDAERPQIRDLLDEAREGARVLHAGGWMTREPAHVHLVDDGVLQRLPQGLVAFPVVNVRRRNARAKAGAFAAPSSRAIPQLVAHEPRPRIQELARRIEPEAVCGRVRPIGAPRVIPTRARAADEHVPKEIRAMRTRIELHLEQRRAVDRAPIKPQPHLRRAPGEDRKIDAVRGHRCAGRGASPARDLEGFGHSRQTTYSLRMSPSSYGCVRLGCCGTARIS